MEIRNVTTDWNNGLALSALNEFCQPGLCPNYKNLNPDARLSNTSEAMNAAEKNFKIPKVLSPEFFVSPYVDELSMMTYLSYYTQPGSIGEKRTLEFINESAPGLNVKNFNTDWNDGKTLCRFLEAQCPGIIPDFENLDNKSPLENATVALNVAEEKLGITKVLSPEELVSPDVDELSIMAYMLQFRTAEKLQSQAHLFKADGAGIKRGVRGKTSEFSIFGRKDISFNGVRIEVKGPSGGEPVSVERYIDTDGSLKCKFVPFECGPHTISVKHFGKEIPQGPFNVMVHENVGDVQVTGAGIKNAVVNKQAEFIVHTNDDSSPPVTAAVEGPTKTAYCTMEPLGNGKWRGTFIPKEVGEHKVRIEVGSTPLLGSPFTCKVGDPSKCSVTGKGKQGLNFCHAIFCVSRTIFCVTQSIQLYALSSHTIIQPARTMAKTTITTITNKSKAKNVRTISHSITYSVFFSENSRNPAMGRPASYEVDTSGAGLGELAIQCRGPGGNVPVDVRPTAPGKYNVSFIPNKPGEYNVHFVFNGEDIPGSPVKALVNDPSRIVAHGDGLHQVSWK